MSKHTYAERLVAGLTSLGYSEVRSRSGKYQAFMAPTGDPTKLYFVGPSGALRTGTAASTSFSIGCPTIATGAWQRIIAAGDSALAKKDGNLNAFFP